jgi:hypothetical protein
MPYLLGLKAEALHLADRTSEALEVVNEAVALAERFEQRANVLNYTDSAACFWALGADETRIETSFCEAIKTARQQKSISLEKRAEATCAEYRRQKAAKTETSPAVSASVRTYTQIEQRVLGSPDLEGVALRYGFFYGPGTWFTPDGDVANQVRDRKLVIPGSGQGVWSWLHVEDAAAATVAALECTPGVYNIVDSDPSELSVWLPAFAAFVRAPTPLRVSEADALQSAGPDWIYYSTRLRGASNTKAKGELRFAPRKLEWLAKRGPAT